MRLYLHTFFRSHKNTATVYMRIKADALFFYFAEFSKRKDLKSAAVCKNRTAPPREFVKTAEVVNQIIPRSYVKVVCVAQHNLCFDIFKINGRKTAFYCARRCYVHKCRGVYGSVYGFKIAKPCIADLFNNF